MRVTCSASRLGLLVAVLALTGCDASGPSPWNECGAELQECCGGGACNAGLICAEGACAIATPESLFGGDAGVTDCGGEGEACCVFGARCAGELSCQSGTCQRREACGDEGQACCALKTQCAGTLVCQLGRCQAPSPCGDHGQVCCQAGPGCKGTLTCQEDSCTPPAPCGDANQACCTAGAACMGTLACAAGACVPAPDLVVQTLKLSLYGSRAGGVLYICLEQDPSGHTRPAGERVVVRNAGPGPSGPYHVNLGIQSAIDWEFHSCPFNLVDDTGLEPGATSQWSGWCCSIGLDAVPADLYWVTAIIDPEHEVDEVDESNNVARGELFSLP